MVSLRRGGGAIFNLVLAQHILACRSHPNRIMEIHGIHTDLIVFMLRFVKFTKSEVF